MSVTSWENGSFSSKGDDLVREGELVSRYSEIRNSSAGRIVSSMNLTEGDFTSGVEISIAPKLMAIPVRFREDGDLSDGAIPVSLHSETDESGPLDRRLARFWGRIVTGRLSYTESGFAVFEESDGGFTEISPVSIYGDLKDSGSAYRTAVAVARSLGIGRMISRNLISVDGELLGSGEGDPSMAISTPDRSADVESLQRKAFGSDAFTGLAMTVGYLLDPDARSQQIILLEDDGGSGKTSLIEAFCKAFPGVAARNLDVQALASGGFAAGNALVPAIGKRVAFSDESGALSMKGFSALAALSTGCERAVRFGGGISEQHRFELKLVIASNSSDSLDRTLKAVSRRIVRIPMEPLHGREWWESDAPGFEGRSRWDVVFSRDGMMSMASVGIRLYRERNGIFPDCVSNVRGISDATREVLLDQMSSIRDGGGERIFIEGEDGDGAHLLLRSSVARGSSGRGRIFRELETACGISSTVQRVRSKTMRVMEVSDMEKYSEALDRYGEEA